MPFHPHDAARHGLQRAEGLLNAANTPGISPSVAGDMRRSSVVLAIAAVDTYMHRLIVDRASMWGQLPNKLARTPIRFDQLVAEAQASYEAARQQPFNSRPGVRTKSALRNQLLLKTFQSLNEIDEALSMAGASGYWGPIGAHMNLSRGQIEKRLSPIVMRRNQIVHEGDYERLDRPQQPRRNELSEGEARSDIQFLRDLVEAIHAAI